MKRVEPSKHLIALNLLQKLELHVHSPHLQCAAVCCPSLVLYPSSCLTMGPMLFAAWTLPQPHLLLLQGDDVRVWLG